MLFYSYTLSVLLVIVSQFQLIHHTYILPRFDLDTASSINRLACPWHDSGSDGAAPTPTTTPSSLLRIFSSCSLARPVSAASLCPFALLPLVHSTNGS